MPKEPTPQPETNLWSDPINGLSGRLRVEFEDLQPGLRHAIYLELRNHLFTPVAVTNQPQTHAELFDSAGNPVDLAGFPVSGPAPDAQWAVIPRDAYMGLRVDMQTVGVPTREHGMALLAIGGKSWALKASQYVLNVRLEYNNQQDGPDNQWVGNLTLPPVEVVVTPEMVARG